jgi:hypothetical protein
MRNPFFFIPTPSPPNNSRPVQPMIDFYSPLPPIVERQQPPATPQPPIYLLSPPSAPNVTARNLRPRSKKSL